MVVANKSQEFIINETIKNKISGIAPFDIFGELPGASVCIFGTGRLGEEVYSHIKINSQKSNCGISVAAFLDNNQEKWGMAFCGQRIQKPDFETISSADLIIIASMWHKEIREQLVRMGVNPTNITYAEVTDKSGVIIQKYPDQHTVNYAISFARRVYDGFLKPRLLGEYKKGTMSGPDLNNILHVNTVDCKGGAAKVASYLATGASQLGYTTKMLVREKFSDDNNVEVITKEESPEQKLLNLAQKEKSWLDFFHLSSFHIPQTDYFKKADMLHLHNLHGNYFSYFVLPEMTALKPTIWTFHDEQPFTGHCAYNFDECDQWLTGCKNCPNLGIYPSLERNTPGFIWKNKYLIYKNSNFTVVCPSNWLKKKVERSMLKDKEVYLIYNGIDERIYQKVDKVKARNLLKLPLDKKLLLFSANGGINNPFKGGQYLEGVYKAIGQNEAFLFINIGGEASRSLDKGINWIDIAYISDEKALALYYAAADLFLFPSIADNCPLVVLECMACGTPIITFDTGGIPELVSHMDNGYIAKYKDSDDFIRGTQLFLNDNYLRKEAGLKARQKVERNFTLKKMTHQYIKLYEDVWSKWLMD